MDFHLDGVTLSLALSEFQRNLLFIYLFACTWFLLFFYDVTHWRIGGYSWKKTRIFRQISFSKFKLAFKNTHKGVKVSQLESFWLAQQQLDLGVSLISTNVTFSCRFPLTAGKTPKPAEGGREAAAESLVRSAHGSTRGGDLTSVETWKKQKMPAGMKVNTTQTLTYSCWGAAATQNRCGVGSEGLRASGPLYACAELAHACDPSVWAAFRCSGKYETQRRGCNFESQSCNKSLKRSLTHSTLKNVFYYHCFLKVYIY